MKLSAFLTIVLFLCCSIMLAVPDATEAARLGGGSSFGSKPFMSTPAPRPTMRQDAPQAPRSSMNQPQAAPQAPRPGMFGGMGGLFGGLLAGTLLGSLLGGHGFAGGGFMDIILIGLLVFFGLKLFARFRGQQAPAGAGARRDRLAVVAGRGPRPGAGRPHRHRRERLNRAARGSPWRLRAASRQWRASR